MHAHPAFLSHVLGQRVLVCMPDLWGQWEQCLREAVPCKPDHCTSALARLRTHSYNRPGELQVAGHSPQAVAQDSPGLPPVPALAAAAGRIAVAEHSPAEAALIAALGTAAPSAAA